MSSDAGSGEFDSRSIAAIGCQEAMHRYYWFARYEESNRLQSRRALTPTIDLWQRAIELRSRPLAAGATVRSQASMAEVEPIYQHLSFDYRLSQSIVTISTSKVALDAVLEGYYTQGLMLMRNLLEAAKRIAYARRSPCDSFRWFPREWFSEELIQQFGDTYVTGPPSGRDWRRVFPDHPSPGLDEFLDWQMNQGINAHINDLHSHAHPTAEGFRQQRLDKPLTFALSPEFNEQRAFVCLRTGCFAEAYLMHELTQLLPSRPEWQEDIDRWRNDFCELFEVDNVINTAQTVQRMRQHEAGYQ